MARGLDHIVHAVRDLEGAGDFYKRLGFQVGARNRHPWGTENRLVQFSGFFLEILAVVEPAKIGSKTFGAFNDKFLNEVGEGLSGLVVEGRDPKVEYAALDAAGFGGIPLLEFSRQGKRADGTETEVGFKIAFARYSAAAHVLFFTCMQTAPENFWSAELQRHPNGARQIAATVLVAENPADHHIFLEALTGVRDIRATSLGLTIPTPRGAIQVMDPHSFKQAFGVDAPKDAELRLAALVFKVADLRATRALLERNCVPAREQAGRLVVEPEAAFGATVAFSI
jgi:catechol 2,3-dioxygenase-like lactoylglutathione lyase family enzyme